VASDKNGHGNMPRINTEGTNSNPLIWSPVRSFLCSLSSSRHHWYANVASYDWKIYATDQSFLLPTVKHRRDKRIRKQFTPLMGAPKIVDWRGTKSWTRCYYFLILCIPSRCVCNIPSKQIEIVQSNVTCI
jgi:hypothetical protein